MDATAYIKHYDVGTVVSVVIPEEIDALSNSLAISTDDDGQLNHRYIDSMKNPVETVDKKKVWHFFHQFTDATHEVHLNRLGKESIEIEKVEQNILGNPWIEFIHERTRKVGETNFATVQILSDSGVRVGFNIDSEYDWLSFETFDEKKEEWVSHRWEQIYLEAFDEYRWGNMCECDRAMPKVLQTQGRLKLFGIRDGEKEHIPLIRRRGDLQR